MGPRSAGADPGPLCYGRGGTEVTVTDAHVFLGRVPPHLLGGEIPLDADAAREGVEALAGKVGLTPERTAAGILEISAFNQSNAIRQITVKRGLDVRDFPMVAFGGSGPLLVCRLIDILGLPSVIVPPDPGNVSAFGLLTVDVKNDYVRTCVHAATSPWPDRSRRSSRDLEGQAAEALDREGFAADRHVYARSADLRYYGQAYEVRVPAPAGRWTRRGGPRCWTAFTRRTRSSTGTATATTSGTASSGSTSGSPASARSPGPAIGRRPYGDGATGPEPATARQVFYDELGPGPDPPPGGPGRRDGDRRPRGHRGVRSTLPMHPGFTAPSTRSETCCADERRERW